MVLEQEQEQGQVAQMGHMTQRTPMMVTVQKTGAASAFVCLVSVPVKV